MTRFALVVPLLALTLASSGCDIRKRIAKKVVEQATGVEVEEDKGTAKFKAKGEKGSLEVSAGKGVKLPADLPFKLKKGYELVNVTSFEDDKKAMTIVTVRYDDLVGEELQKLYGKQFEDEGYKLTRTQTTLGELGMFMVVARSGKDTKAMANISEDRKNDKTTLQLSYGDKL